MPNSPTQRSTELKFLQLHKMPTGEHWNFLVSDVERLNEKAIRIHVSQLNRQHHTNLKCHKNEDKTLTVWHDPTPRTIKPLNPLFEELLNLQAKVAQLKTEIKRKLACLPQENASADLELYGQMEDRLNVVVAKLKDEQIIHTRRNSGGRIIQPLDVILNRLGITKEIWDLQTGYEKTRRWIAEEVKIKLEKEITK
jgi:hypothetical protein